MKTVSLKIDDLIFEETEIILSRNRKARNRYINEAIDYYNKLHKKRYLENKLKTESSIVAEDSLEIMHEFEALENYD